jgi:hypothetical protein
MVATSKEWAGQASARGGDAAHGSALFWASDIGGRSTIKAAVRRSSLGRKFKAGAAGIVITRRILDEEKHQNLPLNSCAI